MSSRPPKLDKALQRFFSAPNRLDLDRIEQTDEDHGVGRFRRWIVPLRLPEPQGTLLPCQRETGGSVDWYAVAFDDRELRTLGEELTAFVGPSYSRFRGERARLDVSDPVENAVLSMSQGRAFRVTAPPEKEAQADLWKVLERMREVRARRQEREPETLQAAGRTLRDFFLALRAGNRDGAENLLRLLRDRYEFGTWNLLFLRVQMLSDLGRWEELLGLPQMGDLLRIRRPLAVTEALLTAVYHVELEVFEFRDDPADAAEHFHREVRPRYAPLFAYRTGMRSPEVLKTFMLTAVSATEPDLELRDEVLRAARLSVSEQRYLERLAALAPESPPSPMPVDRLARAREAWAKASYDMAFDQASDAPPSLARGRILLQCAYEMPALEVRSAAIEAINNLAQEEREQLLGSRWAREFWSDLSGPEEEDAAAGLPNNWIEWLERLDRGWDNDVAVEIARQGADQWNVESLLEVPGGVRHLADDLMAARSPGLEATVRDAVPHLLASVQRDLEWPRRDFLPLYNSLLFLLATTERGGRDELNLFNDILAALLELGMSAAQYRDVVGWGSELWERFPAPRNIDWVLDQLDLLAAYPSTDKEVRLRLLQGVASTFHQFVGQGLEIEPQQWLLFRSRCKELGHAELLEAFPTQTAKDTIGEAEETGFAALKGQSVALYTLTESVGQRVAAFLKEVCPSVTVEVSHDHVCTERLRAAAKNADIFVMATMSAKHAATGCIEANRNKGRPLLRPAGKGSASMLASLASFLSGTGAVGDTS
jgi:hypothetical protein